MSINVTPSLNELKGLTMSISASQMITFPKADGKHFLRLDFSTDPPGIWVDPDLPWDAAAKQFWNAMHRVIGRPAPFSG